MIKIKNLICKIALVIISAFFLAGCSGRDNTDLVTGNTEINSETETDQVLQQEDTPETDKESEGTVLSVEESVNEGTSGAGSINADAGSNDIYVYVCGAVIAPDVYVLKEGSRAEDALEAAGGFDENANRLYVNLAEILQDGQRLYFPYEDDESEILFAEEKQSAEGSSDSSESTCSFPININTADVSQLCNIPGIGESKARAIIEYREANGRFEYAADITNVSGIGEATYGKIAEYICTD